MAEKHKGEIPSQIQPAIDPNPPTTDSRYSYYILEEPNSPSVAPPNAIRVTQYRRRQFILDDPEDYRRPYGYAEYERELTFGELDQYNLLPFDPNMIAMFDLWQSFEQDGTALLAFFVRFFKVIEADPKLSRLKLATRLARKGWTLRTVRALIREIK